MRFAPLGDQAVMITLGTSIDEPTHRLVRSVVSRLRAAAPAAMTDLVPAFASVAVHYEPAIVGGDRPYARFVETLEAALAEGSMADGPTPRTIEIPVCYEGELAPDLEEVARRHGLSASDVVELHTAGEYLVYMIGFMPGFAYLGGLSPRLATPRRASPRTAVPSGAVGIGGQQTGVYPMVSPGGWNLIGRTPRAIFDSAREPAALLDTGDRVRFRAITRAEFDAWSE